MSASSISMPAAESTPSAASAASLCNSCSAGNRPAAIQLPSQRRRETPTLSNVLSRNTAENGRAQRGRVDGSPGREVRPGR
eukprot:15485453-Alexandrium_andersonii.AAC.1